ncbi:MAG: Na+/H+ antiporter NhaC family protein [Deltaproteobacteria bacterium]|jgi:Na+/H+ antiporter NhaC|nr:Na+/H+ antiporter NhaC family protein [Deltaproteobacteria bacterium]
MAERDAPSYFFGEDNVDDNPSIKFHCGKFVSAVPMLFFIVWAITICVFGAPDVKGLILGVMIGLVIAMFFVRGSWSTYCDQIFSGMSSKIGVVAIGCWLWAGIFAQILRVGGLVDGLVWLGHFVGMTGGFFAGTTFLLAALFASAVGTGYGTTVAFCTLMYPTGIILGADPVLLFGAILSGSAFGDNLAPVSDTTIVSATTQDTDVPGVVKSRFKYAIIAAIPAIALYIIFGSAGETALSTTIDANLISSGDPKGLILLIPFVIVITLAMSGRHIITSITWGILSALALILVFKLTAGSLILNIDKDHHAMTGALIDGIDGYVDMAVLILLIMAANHIMKIGGAMDAIKAFTLRIVKQSIRRAEIAIWAFVACLNFFITVNTAAEIAAAPFVSAIGKIFKIHPYRRANFLDAISSALGYIFPWSGGVLIGYATILELSKEGMPWITVISPTEVWPYVFHGWILVFVMLIAAITGFGRKLEK